METHQGAYHHAMIINGFGINGGTGVDGQPLLPTLTGCSLRSQSNFEHVKVVEPIGGSNQITYVHNMMPDGIMLKTEGLGWMDNRCCPP
jgi:hypothetical protein